MKTALIIFQYLLILVVLGLSFQNCSQHSFRAAPSETTTSQVAESGGSGNGQGYTGKTYVEAGKCPNGTSVHARIAAKNDGTYDLTREDCSDITPLAIVVTPETKFGKVVAVYYQGRKFVEETASTGPVALVDFSLAMAHHTSAIGAMTSVVPEVQDVSNYPQARYMQYFSYCRIGDCHYGAAASWNGVPQTNGSFINRNLGASIYESSFQFLDKNGNLLYQSNYNTCGEDRTIAIPSGTAKIVTRGYGQNASCPDWYIQLSTLEFTLWTGAPPADAPSKKTKLYGTSCGDNCIESSDLILNHP